MIGDFLPIQLIYGGKTNRCHPQFSFPSDWHVTHSKKHWSNEQTMLQYIEEIVIPYVERTRDLIDKSPDTPACVIMDNLILYLIYWMKTIFTFACCQLIQLTSCNH